MVLLLQINCAVSLSKALLFFISSLFKMTTSAHLITTLQPTAIHPGLNEQNNDNSSETSTLSMQDRSACRSQHINLLETHKDKYFPKKRAHLPGLKRCDSVHPALFVNSIVILSTFVADDCNIRIEIVIGWSKSKSLVEF